jgi:hypothetical protein
MIACRESRRTTSSSFSSRFVSHCEDGGYATELTGCLDESRVVLLGQQGIWQIPEELLEQARNAIHIVEEVLRVAEIEVGGAGILNR